MAIKVLKRGLVTAMVLLALLMGNTTKAQETKTVYYFGMSVLKNKNFAVTPVISSTILATNYVATCRNELEKYMIDFIPAETEYEIDWSNRSTATSTLGGTSYSDASKTRLEFINKYKNYGYNIVYLSNMDFRCSQ